MERRFETELKDLKNRIAAMGGYVEQSIDKATQALATRNAKLLEEVFKVEKSINEAHIAVDSACLEILARLSPVAADLRLILAIIKINTDLERMGDQAVNIAYNAEHYIQDPAVKIDVGLTKMAEAVKVMVREALDAFMRGDIHLAQHVLEADDVVDEHKNNVFRLLIPYMKSETGAIESALNLILIARNLERMGDHATNIAEDVIFACTGEDVRHGLGQP